MEKSSLQVTDNAVSFLEKTVTQIEILASVAGDNLSDGDKLQTMIGLGLMVSQANITRQLEDLITLEKQRQKNSEEKVKELIDSGLPGQLFRSYEAECLDSESYLLPNHFCIFSDRSEERVS